MANLLDRVGLACATTGTGPFTAVAALGAVAPNLASFQDMTSAGAVDGKPYRYLILDSNGAWERGKGTWTASGGTFTRTVRFSSNSNSAINLSGNAQVFISPDENDLISISSDQTAVFTASERAQARVNVGAAMVAALAPMLLNPNGGMEVSQENGTSSVTLTASGSLTTKYLVDGVMAAYRGTFVAAAQQVTDAPTGYRYSLKFTVGTAESSLGANDELSVLIPLEGVRTARLAYGAAGANALAIWFWVKAHRTGDYSGSLRNSSKARSYPFSFTVNASDTWEFKSVLISTGDTSGTWLTDTGVGLYLNICIAGGSSRVGTANAWASADYSGVTSTTNGVLATSDVFQFTGGGSLPLVSGVSVADVPLSSEAALITRPFPEELVLSRRYWLQITEPCMGMTSTAGTIFHAAVEHRGMRVAPSPTLTAAALITDVATTNWTQSSAQVTANEATGDGGRYSMANFSGPSNAATYMYKPGGGGKLNLDARL